MDPYDHSTALAKLRQAQSASRPARLAFLDIDGTCTGASADQVAWRTALEQHGFVIAFITNRSPELVLSNDAWEQSSTALHQYPPPSIDPSGDQLQQGLVDPDIIAGRTGNLIAIKQTDGHYEIDEPFRHDVSGPPETWPARKREAADRVFNALRHKLSLSTSSCFVLIAGDGEPDLPMGLLAGAGSQATFIVPGGAPVREQLFSPPLQLKYPLKKQRPGLYYYAPTKRTVIIGDEAFPGTSCVETLLSWLNSDFVPF